MQEASGFKDFVYVSGIPCEVLKDFVYKLGILCEMHEECILRIINAQPLALAAGMPPPSLIGCPAKVPRRLVRQLNAAEDMLTCASNYRILL
jgi:hypothetical protein